MTTSEAISYIMSASSVPAKPATIMVVDDDRIMLTMLAQALEQQNYRVISARTGEEALNKLANVSENVDSIILDREMPGMNGLEVVSRLRADERLGSIPVIMLTGSGNPDQIQEGIDAGVFYYLVKPVTDALLKSVLDASLRERRQKKIFSEQIQRRDSALGAMQSCHIEVKTLTEAEDAACLIAGCFPKPERVVTGLLELLINAVEHGNLGINYEEKAALIASNQWRKEVDRRSQLPEFRDRAAELVYQRREDGHYVQITDSGKGFDWRKFWQIDPARATASHGRGIARARLMAFDRVYYNDIGNQVTAAVSSLPANIIEW